MPRSRLFRVAFSVVIVALLAGALGIFVGLVVVVTSDLPEIERLETYEPKGITTLKDIQGRTIHEFYQERRMNVPLEKIPINVRQAYLAAEDWRFYEHAGIDVKGLFRAVIRNLWEQKYAEGASTITQQLAKVLFLSPEKTLERKLKEAWIAVQIERRYSKNEILGLYLNQIYLGAGCYGVQAAAKTYFNKDVGDLTDGETAMLAALPKAPNIYSPFKDPQKARERRDIILGEMFTRGLLTKEAWRAAREEPLPERQEQDDRIQTYFAAYNLMQLIDQLGEELVFRGKLNVQTTLDLSLQKTAEAAVGNGIEAYARRHKIPLDQPDRLPQAALLAVDVESGEIRAMVGGRSFAESQFNRAVQAVRQPGSSFKPILYAAAIASGYTESTMMEDETISFDNPVSGLWEPKNYENDYDGWIPLRIALERSKNVVAVRLLKSIGFPALAQMVSRLGFTSPIAPNLSSALGSSSVTLPELARAFAVFANGGIRNELHSIRSVQTDTGLDFWPPPPPSQPVLDPRIAFVMTDLLHGVIEFGTGTFAKDLPCNVAGKTGTTDNNVDALFVGFSPEIVAITWIGFDDRKTLGNGETGAVAAGPMWKEFMLEGCKQNSEADWKPPPGVLLVDVDHSSGRLPSRYCTDVIAEAFLEGTAPTETCDEEEIPRL
ncbi:MAG TPA: PBP1A family penicillin-binding protein [Bdellovibrionota bacterium]|nr:PBP1A family penicillin-binding protein [Bdellovibrionota bacterium]